MYGNIEEQLTRLNIVTKQSTIYHPRRFIYETRFLRVPGYIRREFERKHLKYSYQRYLCIIFEVFIFLCNDVLAFFELNVLTYIMEIKIGHVELIERMSIALFFTFYIQLVLCNINISNF